MDIAKEAIQHLVAHEVLKRVFATDIDETLIRNTYQHTVDKKTGAKYTAPEWAKLEDRYEDIGKWDFTSEWEDEKLNVDSILLSEGIQANFDVITEYRKRGFKIVYITSRGGGSRSIQPAIDAAMSQRLGFNTNGYALGDYETYGKDKLPIKKKRILEDLVREYDEVVFMDDEAKNLELAREVPGVTVLEAHK